MTKMSAREISATLANLYKHSNAIDKFFAKYRPYICPFEEILPLVTEDKTLLDVGCGKGLFCCLARKQKQLKEIHGIDVCEPAIKTAQKINEEHALNIQFEAAEPFIFPTQQYGVVTCIDVLHHIPKQQQKDFVIALKQCVKPSGILIIKDMSPTPWWKAKLNALHDLIVAKEYISTMYQKNVEKILTEANDGKITVSKTANRLWYGHYYSVWQKD